MSLCVGLQLSVQVCHVWCCHFNCNCVMKLRGHHHKSFIIHVVTPGEHEYYICTLHLNISYES